MLGATSTTTAADLGAASVAGVAHQIVDALEALDHDGSDGRLAGRRRPRCARRAAAGGGRPLRADARGRCRAGGDRSRRRHVGHGGGRAARRDVTAPEIARRVPPRLEAGGRAPERSRWQEAVEVHVRERARERGSTEPVRQGRCRGQAGAGGAGRPRRRRRDHRRGHRARRGVTRPLRRADRGGRSGGGNLQPVEQAHSRRPAVSRDAGVPARARSAARAAAAAHAARAPPRAAGASSCTR